MTEPVLELTLKGAEDVVAVACGTCRRVAPNRTMAQNCCGPNACRKCGAECERSWLSCQDCIQKESAAKEQALYDKAIKVHVADYDHDQVCQEPYGGEDEYVAVDEWDSEERGRNWAWACEPMTWPKLDAGDIVSSILEDQFPEHADDQLDVRALQKALDTWLEAQSPSNCFMADHTRIVLFPEVDFSGEEMMPTEEPSAEIAEASP